MILAEISFNCKVCFGLSLPVFKKPWLLLCNVHLSLHRYLTSNLLCLALVCELQSSSGNSYFCKLESKSVWNLWSSTERMVQCFQWPVLMQRQLFHGRTQPSRVHSESSDQFAWVQWFHSNLPSEHRDSSEWWTGERKSLCHSSMEPFSMVSTRFVSVHSKWGCHCGWSREWGRFKHSGLASTNRRC